MQYESVIHAQTLPYKIFLNNVNKCKAHLHNDIELLFMLKGSIQVIKGGKEYILEKDDLLLINGNEIHLIYGINDNIILIFQIDPIFALKNDPDIFHKYFILNTTFKSSETVEPTKRLKSVIANIFWENKTKNQGYLFCIESLLNEFFFILERDIPYKQNTPLPMYFKQKGESLLPLRLNRIINFIETNYQQKILVNEIAKNEKINTSYLSRYFKEQMGYNLKHFVNLVRLNKTIFLLTSSEDTISNIAFTAGFRDLRSFNTLFKNTYGTTPSIWRKNYFGEKEFNFKSSLVCTIKFNQNKASHFIKPYL